MDGYGISVNAVAVVAVVVIAVIPVAVYGNEQQQ